MAARINADTHAGMGRGGFQAIAKAGTQAAIACAMAGASLSLKEPAEALGSGQEGPTGRQMPQPCAREQRQSAGMKADARHGVAGHAAVQMDGSENCAYRVRPRTSTVAVAWRLAEVCVSQRVWAESRLYDLLSVLRRGCRWILSRIGPCEVQSDNDMC